ncbi:DUF4231 domain-containing protein [Streptomyces sp. NPDC058304]|uniref:DUF4231 domain-containing protein n=1 Tax=Streptomyces sp. NPDC058304 TaxID=3346437 RepID=UPI0036DFF7F6
MAANGPAEIGLTPVEAAGRLLDKIRQGNEYAHGKKRRFRRSSSVIKMLTLTLSAASTVILGLQNLNVWAGFAFALVALGTLLGAIEPFFNWRSRWVLMEETQHRFQRLADELEHFLATTAVGRGIADAWYGNLPVPCHRGRRCRAAAATPVEPGARPVSARRPAASWAHRH